MKKLKLIFTRDFNQWSNQVPRDIIVNIFPKIFGTGLPDQIIIFNGETFGWYRVVADSEKFKQAMTNLPLSHPAFQLSTHETFRADVAKLRQIMEIDPVGIKDRAKFYTDFKELFIKLYPYYALSAFLPGPWAEDFKRHHGTEADKILDRAYQSRLQSEGLVKEITNFMRRWLGPVLVEHGLPANYLKLLTVEEVEDLIFHNKLPSTKLLQARNSGFVVIQNKIYPTQEPKQFLVQHDMDWDEEDTTVSFLQGQTAFGQETLQGEVIKIMTSDQISKFKASGILVTPMTSPDYLSAMKQAKAIITDEGGVTCHAAITARELKIPTIIATKVATKILQDGMAVELDTKKGIVRIIR